MGCGCDQGTNFISTVVMSLGAIVILSQTNSSLLWQMSRIRIDQAPGGVVAASRGFLSW